MYMCEEVFVVSDPEICHGKPVIRGTRVPVSVIIGMLKKGYTPREIHEEYPSVSLRIIEAIYEKLKKGEKLLAEVWVS